MPPNLLDRGLVIVSAPSPAFPLRTKLLTRNPAVTVGIHPRESLDSDFVELGAFHATIAISIHLGKSFGDPLGDPLLNSFLHFLFGDDP
jgi:hypothetical protein